MARATADCDVVRSSARRRGPSMRGDNNARRLDSRLRGNERRRSWRALELHLRRRADGLAILAEVEEVLLRKSERCGEQRRREFLDAGVVFLHRVVEEAARGGELVL